MLPPECQVCDNFDVARTTCCAAWTSSTHHGPDISEFVRREYPSPPSATINNELFRLLNEDIRYELRSLYEDTTAWSAYHDYQGDERRLPPAPARMAQTSAFVHVRLLSCFLTVDDNDPNETRATAFGVKVQESRYLVSRRDAINSNVMHLHELRPRPVVVLRSGRTRNAPQDVQLEVDRLTDEVVRLWHVFVGDPAMTGYKKLTSHIEDEARQAATDTVERLSELLALNEADVPWRPPTIRAKSGRVPDGRDRSTPP